MFFLTEKIKSYIYYTAVAFLLSISVAGAADEEDNKFWKEQANLSLRALKILDPKDIQTIKNLEESIKSENLTNDDITSYLTALVERVEKEEKAKSKTADEEDNKFWKEQANLSLRALKILDPKDIQTIKNLEESIKSENLTNDDITSYLTALVERVEKEEKAKSKTADEEDNKFWKEQANLSLRALKILDPKDIQTIKNLEESIKSENLTNDDITSYLTALVERVEKAKKAKSKKS